MILSGIWTSFSLGLLATTNPCILPLYPGFLAYLTGGQERLANSRWRYFLGFAVLLGVMTMMLIMGASIAFLSISLSRALAIVIPIADLAIMTLGVLLLLNFNPFKALPQIQVPVLSHPILNAFLYGMLYGPITLPCSGPLLVGVFAFSFTVEEALSKLSIFLWFGLGFGLPLLLLSFLSGATQRNITRFFALHSRLVNIVGGFLLIGVAVYDITVNWDLILAALKLSG